MREILFKAKDKNGGYHFGFLVKKAEKFFIVPYNENQEKIEVKPYTISQFIGLYDKNDFMLFEGDMVEFRGEVGKIIWCEEEAKFAVLYEENDVIDFDSLNGQDLILL